ncbi:protein kinase domain-containing protein, partial [Haematococcus lacustris]
VWTNTSGVPVPYDARAVDAWAMGVLMYLLITGKYPFEDPGHPNNLAHTIHNAMAFDPWLMQQARNHALAVGRLDLLEPLMAIGLHGGGEYGAAAPAGGVEDSQASSRATSSGAD